jgi:hypothetical protein
MLKLSIKDVTMWDSRDGRDDGDGRVSVTVVTVVTMSKSVTIRQESHIFYI